MVWLDYLIEKIIQSDDVPFDVVHVNKLKQSNISLCVHPPWPDVMT